MIFLKLKNRASLVWETLSLLRIYKIIILETMENMIIQMEQESLVIIQIWKHAILQVGI